MATGKVVLPTPANRELAQEVGIHGLATAQEVAFPLPGIKVAEKSVLLEPATGWYHRRSHSHRMAAVLEISLLGPASL